MTGESPTPPPSSHSRWLGDASSPWEAARGWERDDDPALVVAAVVDGEDDDGREIAGGISSSSPPSSSSSWSSPLDASSGAAVAAPTIPRILRYTLPAMGIWLCSPVLSMIDTAAVGTLAGTAQQAALNPAVGVSDYVALVAAFMYTATTNLVASAARGDRDDDAAASAAASAGEGASADDDEDNDVVVAGVVVRRTTGHRPRTTRTAARRRVLTRESSTRPFGTCVYAPWGCRRRSSSVPRRARASACRTCDRLCTSSSRPRS